MKKLQGNYFINSGKDYFENTTERIKSKVENTLEDTGHGFRRGRSALGLIFTLRQISEKFLAIKMYFF